MTPREEKQEAANLARHEALCKSCAHPLVSRVEQEWVGWGLTDAEAANLVGVSERSWRRHTDFFGLDDKKIRKRGLAALRIAERAMRSGKGTLGDAVRALKFLEEHEAGGRRVRLDLTELLSILERIEGLAREKGVVPAEALGEIDRELEEEFDEAFEAVGLPALPARTAPDPSDWTFCPSCGVALNGQWPCGACGEGRQLEEG